MIQQPYFEIVLMTTIGVLDFVFAMYIFTRYEKELRITMFGLFALMASGWVFFNGIGLLFERGSTLLDFFGRGTFVFAAYLVAFLYLFMLLFPFPSTHVTRRFVAVVLVPPTILSLIIYFSHTLIVGFDVDRYATTIFGDLIWVYTVYIIYFFFLSLFEIISKLKKADGIHRWQLKYFLFSVAIPGVVAIITILLISPVKYFQFYWIGPSSTIIWLGFCLYIINKK